MPIVRNFLTRSAARAFPAVVLTGPRGAGKTTLLRRLFPRAAYVLLDDPDVQARARSDPRALLEELRLPALFDEIRNAPELLAYIRTRIDRNPRQMGRWLFTGSQEAPLMQGVAESMAGRALWFSSYIRTYIERDVRAVTNVRDLATFRRFLALLASRHGQILNKTDLAAPLGVSIPTVADWLHVLEITGQVILAPPYFENFGKRLIKSPKVYLGDSGLACYLLGITTQAELDRSPFLGALFEGFVAAEILKSQVSQGRRKELYHFRDQQGLEVDFLFPGGQGALWMVECKASKTVQPSMAGPLASLRRSMGDQASVRLSVVHRPSTTAPPVRALAPGIEALDVPAFVDHLQ